jgi:hypothetical protein
MRFPLLPAGTALALLLTLVGACSDDPEADAVEGGSSEVLGDADEGIEGVQALRVYYSSPVHTAEADGEVEYELLPPAGGMHRPIWWNCGFYDEPIPDENAVHDLEHGAVWLAYSPELDEADVEVLHDVARANDKVLVSPYEDLDAGVAVVATAWARQLTLDGVDDPRLAAFVEQYQSTSLAPEGGATCSGTDLGTPIP